MAETGTEGVFSIMETNGETGMKNIRPSTLKHFLGLTYEDSNTLMFKFVVVYKIYDYASDDQKLKLFPSTVKDSTLLFFMGWPRKNITT